MLHRLSFVLLAALAAVLVGGHGEAKGPEVFPLSQVRPGQKGYGLTVFRGTTPERFDFEVVGIVKNMLPRMDIIIVRSEDPKLTTPGMARGMSGSPLYIDGKVACAFAYAWAFNKQAMGGCTPIEYMLADANRPRRDPHETAQAQTASLDEWRRHAPMERFLAAATPEPKNWFAQNPLPPRPPAPVDSETSLVRASIPLSVTGLGPSAFEQARKVFEPYHIEPMQGAGGAGDPKRGPTSYEMGGNVAVRLAAGDFSSAATCAVSYVDGDKALGCGHPMFTLGQVSMPAAAAEIHTIIPSAQLAFKLASPLRELGALVQDRKTGIVADTSKQADMVPVDIKIKTPAGEQEFHSQVVDHRFLTPQLTTLALASALELLSPDITDATMTLRSSVAVRGKEPLYFTDYLYSADGLSLAAVQTARGLRVLVPLLFNPYEPVKLERIQLEATLAYKADYAEIVGLRLPDLELPAGEETWVDVDMRPYNGRVRTVRVPLLIPKRLAGALVKLEVVPGDQAKPDTAPPENLEQVLDVLRNKTFPANVLVATLYTPNEGVSLSGRVIPDLPDSALDTARPAAATRRVDAYRSILRQTVPLKQVATGKQEMVIKVADPE
jgi:hypothetical protein